MLQDFKQEASFFLHWKWLGVCRVRIVCEDAALFSLNITVCQPAHFLSLEGIQIKCSFHQEIHVCNTLDKTQVPLIPPTLTHINVRSSNENLPAYVLALLRRSVHACMSAKARIPRQLIGWSWDSKNSQQVLFTSCSCKRPAAGSSTWKEKQELVNVPIQFWCYTRVLWI